MTRSAETAVGLYWPEGAAEITLAYDTVLRRPGCVNVQAGMGTREGARAVQAFETRHWVTAPTEYMRPMRVTRDQMVQLVDMSEGRMGPGRAPAGGES